MEIFLSCVEIFLRALFSLIALFLLSKLIGPRQISQMDFYDYIVGITIGSIAAVAAVDIDIPVYIPFIAMVTYALFTFLIALWTDKSILVRRFFTGIPKLLIDNGNIIEKNLKRNHLDLNDLLSSARTEGYFNIGQIAYAIMESTGKISFLPYGDNRPLTPADVGKHPQDADLFANVVMDGNVMVENLMMINKSESWLKTSINALGFKDYDEVLLAVADQSGNIRAYRKNVPPTKGYFI
ncbi:MAG: DUF421 domain-containing protein [Clostridiales bacterium]|nr:MAG: DUF421 domain-containing protein [Clostridiales bacterium]